MNLLAAMRPWLGAPEMLVVAMILAALWFGMTTGGYAKEEEVRADLERLRTLLFWLTIAGIILIIFTAFRHYPGARLSMW